MTIAFADSARSTVGVEWEVMLADPQSGDLVGRAPELLDALEAASANSRHTVTGELLTNTVEVTSGVGGTVAEAIGDISEAIREVRAATDPAGIALLSAGSHPFAQWYDQKVTDKTRYHSLIERTQWWGRNMMIWGIHVHVGVEDRDKVLPIVGALGAYLPHLQALAASSPFWAGERTGYASNRALVFQQLPTAGLPWPLHTWAEYEGYLDDMVRTGVMSDATEVRWDIRPAPRWGTIEVRACDGMSTLRELAAIAALTQVLVEHLSRRLDEGESLPVLQPWYHRENKWRTARYGLDATVIVDSAGAQRPVREHLIELLETLAPVAVDLRCGAEFARVGSILDTGASYERQLAVADTTGGDLRMVVQHLIDEFRTGPHHHLS
ncbi:glutamate--cysteine ligase [Microbacterium sp. NPDC057650]|uniref:glutamate--cysteine ligase n=1 Tax=unclassified Microbacterium TaxID=2609290 RepID=UPI00366D6B0B